jgi:hypothetical protein
MAARGGRAPACFVLVWILSTGGTIPHAGARVKNPACSAGAVKRDRVASGRCVGECTRVRPFGEQDADVPHLVGVLHCCVRALDELHLEQLVDGACCGCVSIGCQW